MNKFYSLNIVFQWIIAILMFAFVCFLLFLWSFSISFNVLGILLVFLLIPLFQFFATPFFTLTKTYSYLSPMLLVYAANEKQYDLHNGTSFDYLFVLYNTKSGTALRYKLLSYYLDGLLVVIEKLEQKEIPLTIVIRGSSYFFSERTVRKLGFSISKTGWSEKFNIIINYFDLFWMYSLSSGRIAFPNLGNINTVSISGADLLKQKQAIIRLNTYLKGKLS